MEVTIERQSLALRAPLRTAFGEVRSRDLLLLRVRDEEGLEGVGEAAPLEAYDGVPSAVCEAALERHAEVLRAWDGAWGPAVVEACREAADLPQALAAVDLALWDRAGRRAGKPVAGVLAEDGQAPAVRVNATIGAQDAAGAAAEAATAARAGFRCVKVKVGVGDDARRVAAVRAAVGPEVALRLDANGAWEVDEAVRWIDVLSAAGLELVEEPVHGVAALRAVRERVPVRIAMDETAAQAGAIGSGAADAVVLKLGRAGGISALLAQAAYVKATGADVLLASTFDGPRGIAAAVHVAAALGLDAPCGLATLGLFEDASLADLLPVRDGQIAVPGAPGLGVAWP
ncbi:mandelate racemase/muconate lactonizing enzyme family protein [Conexibacter sp. SYSU D00693]|uniref:mandelate racemase/muconate lactonizing enzyme family protein n=1 Tax=Conexibacter sp. SYSU D00693 TaxID=2812560 RepID=UPI00196A3699|nr:mandelate racemase/muconate lactonizing enzyme family protein [Conexibacter sp. SYSU D00693]